MSGVRYENIVPEAPPRVSVLVRGDGWWGTGQWLVRGAAPDGQWLRTVGALGPIVAKIQAALPAAKDPELLPARFAGDGEPAQEGKEKAARIRIGCDSRFNVDPFYLLYAEAAGRVQEWRWLSEFTMHDAAGATGGPSGLLVGLRAGLPVAAVAPTRRTDIDLTSPLQDSEGGG